MICMHGYAFHGAQVMYGGTLHGDLDISGSIFRGVPGNVYAAMVWAHIHRKLCFHVRCLNGVFIMSLV